MLRCCCSRLFADLSLHSLTASLLICGHTAGEYAIQHHTKPCSSGTKLTTIHKCSDAKAALDPSDTAVKPDNASDAPGGCSRFQGKWYFNSLKGALDGASEPVCKATSGNTTCVYLHDFKIYICPSVPYLNIVDVHALAQPLWHPIKHLHNRRICGSACIRGVYFRHHLGFNQ